MTSGGRRRALDSTRDLSDASRQTQGRLFVMVGGGLNPENITAVAEQSGAAEYHAALNTGLPSPVRFRNDSLFLGAYLEREYMRYIVREEDVRSLREGLERANGSRAAAMRDLPENLNRVI
jgi:copper homeostasis protein